MKKKIILMSLLAAFVWAGCENNKEEFLDEYSVRTYFKNSGVEPLVLYKTGENTQYTAVINKAGSDLQATASVTVGVMNEVELSLYNETNGTDFTLLPDHCYQLDAEKILNFTSSDTYKHFGVTFKTGEVEQLQSTNPTFSYVVPLYITSSEEIINSEKDKVMIQPSVVVPSIYFVNSGLLEKSHSGSSEIVAFECPISLPLKNQWTFDVEIAVDENLLNDYNVANKTHYQLLPVAAYQMDPIIPFVPLVSEKPVMVNIDFSKLDYGIYMLPLKLSATTNPNFIIDESSNTCLLAVTYRLPKVNLQVNMLSSNALEPKEGSLAALLDGNISTYFHSEYSQTTVPESEMHYLQVSLAESIQKMQFTFTTRKENGNAAPAGIYVEISDDGANFERIAYIKEDLPKTAATQYYSQVITSPTEFKYIRILNEKANNGKKYFVFSEFGLFGE